MFKTERGRGFTATDKCTTPVITKWEAWKVRWKYFYTTGEDWKSGPYVNNMRQRHFLPGYWGSQMDRDLMRGNFVDDVEDGQWESWFENGRVKDKGSFKKGVMNGLWEGWYPNGVVHYKGSWNGDLRVGEVDDLP